MLLLLVCGTVFAGTSKSEAPNLQTNINTNVLIPLYTQANTISEKTNRQTKEFKHL